MDRSRELKGVIFQAAVDWDFLKQRPHHLAEAFSQLGLQVLFIENTGTRVPGFSDLARMFSRLRHLFARTDAPTGGKDTTSVEILSPAVLPFPFSRLAQKYNGRYMNAALRGYLDRHRLAPQSVAMITYLATPLATSLCLGSPWFATVYDIVSDPKKINARVGDSERALLEGADLILFASEALRQAYGGGGDERKRLFRDGFSLELLQHPGEVESNIADLPSPKFLYLGGLNRKVWSTAIECLADDFPCGTVILVGPVTDSTFTLPRRSNIRVFPQVTNYQDLAGLLQSVEIGLIPYVPDEYASVMYPAKINEYLVYGLPIVATQMPELLQLDAQIGCKTVYTALQAEDFPVAAREALLEDGPRARESRKVFTKTRTWKKQARSLLQMINTRGGE